MISGNISINLISEKLLYSTQDNTPTSELGIGYLWDFRNYFSEF